MKRRIAMMQPQLATADAVLRYLRRIDDARIYSNFGPLAIEFEHRLARHMGLSIGQVVAAGSGTAALSAAVLAAAGKATEARPFALLPAYTFIATASAVEACGYRPLLTDVDEETWRMHADLQIDQSLLDKIGVVVPVAPYGRVVPQAEWAEFRTRTGIPVVIDGAACFEAASANPSELIGEAPLVLSFHATKSFGCGEGGAILCHDASLVARALEALNFGFSKDRSSRSASFNGKMSEYHAAVGLAEFDGWPQKQASYSRVAAAYKNAFAERLLVERLQVAPEVGSSYALLDCGSESMASTVREALEADGIDCRLWYGLGLHAHPWLRDCRRLDTSVTDRIAPRVLGLPLSVDIHSHTLCEIAESVGSVMGS